MQARAALPGRWRDTVQARLRTAGQEAAPTMERGWVSSLQLPWAGGKLVNHRGGRAAAEPLSILLPVA